MIRLRKFILGKNSTETMPCSSQCSTLRYITLSLKDVVVQSLSHVRFFATPWSAAHQASLPFTISWSSLKPMSNELMTPYNHSSLLPPSSPALNLSQPQGLFQCIGSKHRVALHWLRGHVYLSCGVLLVPYPPERSLHLQFYRNHMQLLLS